MKRALVIVNSKSRNGEGVANKVVEGLQRIGIDTVLRNCGAPSELSPLIKEQGKAVDLAVIAGGDGTLNAAAEGLMAVGLPMAIIPTGTANDLARTLGIPEDVEKAIALIKNSRLRSIDIGKVNDKPFFNVASMGLSVELAKRLSRDVKSRFGKLGYAFVAARVLSHARPFRAHIKHSGRVTNVATLQIAVGNGRFYGGGNVIEKAAAIDDGRLNLYSLEFMRAWKLVLMLRSFRRGEHGTWREVRAVEADEFEIRTRHPRPVNADGEIVTQTPARFQVLPAAIKVYVPDEPENEGSSP